MTIFLILKQLLSRNHLQMMIHLLSKYYMTEQLIFLLVGLVVGIFLPGFSSGPGSGIAVKSEMGLIENLRNEMKDLKEQLGNKEKDIIKLSAELATQ